MAQFDVYRSPDSPVDYWLDCQNDVIDSFDTRFIVPLTPATSQKQPTYRLHPQFEIEGNVLVMATQLASAVPARLLQQKVTSLANRRDEIIAAFDMLLTGI